MAIFSAQSPERPAAAFWTVTGTDHSLRDTSSTEPVAEPGSGVTAELVAQNGIPVYTEEEIETLI
jgi:hypothetical protein